MVLGAYCPISLLITLSKMLQSLIAEKIAFMISYNHFNGLRQKITFGPSRKIYQIWKDRKVLFFIIFDIKGAFNEAVIEVLFNCL